MSNKRQNPGEFKTEEQLKAEAKARAEQEARLAAEAPPVSARMQKIDNFWYHYKWPLVAAVVVLIIAGVLLRDLLVRTEPDTVVVLASSAVYEQAELDALQKALEAAAWDGNEDGKVKIDLNYIYLPDPAGEAQPGANAQAEYAGTVKLAAVMSAGYDPLFLLDDAVFDYFRRTEAVSALEGGEVPDDLALPSEVQMTLFQPLGIAGASSRRMPLAVTVLAGEPGCEVFADLAFSLRPPPEQGDDGTAHAYAYELLQWLADAHPNPHEVHIRKNSFKCC